MWSPFLLNDYELDKLIEFSSTTSFPHKGVCWLCYSLIEAVLELEPSSLLFGIEATGHYYQALAHFLSSLGYNVGLLNSLQTNRLREVDLRRVKIDKIDAKVIPKALVLGYH